MDDARVIGIHLDPASPPLAFGQLRKIREALVVAVHEQRGPRPVAQPAEPVFLLVGTIPRHAEVPADDELVFRREHPALQPATMRQLLDIDAAVDVPSDPDAHGGPSPHLPIVPVPHGTPWQSPPPRRAARQRRARTSSSRPLRHALPRGPSAGALRTLATADAIAL